MGAGVGGPHTGHGGHPLSLCESQAKQGTIVGGLLFIVGGYWLGSQGHGPFGDLVMGLGAVVTLLGVTSPQPTCDQALHRVEILTRIGLEHGWVY